MFLSSDSTSCHEFASQFGLAFFVHVKTLINHHESRPSRIWLLIGPAVPVTMRSETVTVEWPATGRCIDTTAVILSRTD